MKGQTVPETKYLLLSSNTKDRTASRARSGKLDTNVGNIATAQRLTHIAKVGRGRGVAGAALGISREAVEGEALVVRQGKDKVVLAVAGEEAGAVDGAVVERVQDRVVLVGDAGVADADEAVCRAGEEDCWVGGMELELRLGVS